LAEWRPIIAQIAFTLLPGGEKAVEERHTAAQKYLRTLQSRIVDKTICLPDSATESPRQCLERGTMIALCSTIFCLVLGPAFPG